ncbi:MAG: hypothetical protein K1X89_28075 [Myxococcaceae bacterium]|nr:hypothetical protein [Myxococcaceae bacterium]
MALRDDIREVLAEHLDAVPDSDGAKLHVPSLALVLVLEALEARFDLRFSAKDLAGVRLDTVDALVAFVQARLPR